MCGITGIACADPTSRADADTLARMCSALYHRGPDSAGGLAEPGVGLAMRRLSVIDVPGGTQPIFNEDRSIAVVFNGEIYNFRELRDRLIGLGHQFNTSSDTETIVHLFEQYGLDFVQQLHGMFGIAIWDFRNQTLVLARDRLGVKPLYYWHDDSQLVFGSEIKAILQHPSVPRSPNPLAIHQLLTFGHILPPHTAFADVKELPPASTLIYRQGAIEIQSWWDLDFEPTMKFDEQKTTGELMELVRDAVKRRMIADVPLGAFLSGGIDSGIVVAMMSQLVEQPVKTFSIGFDDSHFSELPYARRVAEHCQTDHHEMIVKPDIPAIMPALVAHHDAPFYDSSAVPTWYVSQFARQHVTVAMSGDGGDELFAGYNIYVANKVAGQLAFLPRPLTRLVLSPLAAMIPESSRYINKGRVAREFVQGLALGPLERYTRWATKIKREVRANLYRDATLREHQQIPDHAWLLPWYDSQNHASELGRLLYLGTKTELASDMLRKVDRMSMAHGLEVRSPLLDHLLFEFASKLQDDAKLHGRTTKHALRLIARKLLPHEIVDRPKRGFSIPLDRWLREDLNDYVRAILFDNRTENRGLFDATFVRRLVDEHSSGKISRGREIWTLLTIELWLRDYIDHFAGQIDNPRPLPIVSPMPQGA